MPRRNSAIAALQKLEEERSALDAKQRDLEVKAAQEIGQIILGSGLERYSKTNLRKLAGALGKIDEETALSLLLPGKDTKPPSASTKTG